MIIVPNCRRNSGRAKPRWNVLRDATSSGRKVTVPRLALRSSSDPGELARRVGDGRGDALDRKVSERPCGDWTRVSDVVGESLCDRQAPVAPASGRRHRGQVRLPGVRLTLWTTVSPARRRRAPPSPRYRAELGDAGAELVRFEVGVQRHRRRDRRQRRRNESLVSETSNDGTKVASSSSGKIGVIARNGSQAHRTEEPSRRLSRESGRHRAKLAGLWHDGWLRPARSAGRDKASGAANR